LTNIEKRYMIKNVNELWFDTRRKNENKYNYHCHVFVSQLFEFALNWKARYKNIQNF